MNRWRLVIVIASALLLPGAFSLPAKARQDEIAVWQSTMIWAPNLADVGIALAEHVNQIDAACTVDVDVVMAANGVGPEGAVYAFSVSWSCPPGAPLGSGAVWNSNTLWYPTLADGGLAMSELLNQIDARCVVDVDPIVPAAGSGPEGPVYAFAVTWAC